MTKLIVVLTVIIFSSGCDSFLLPPKSTNIELFNIGECSGFCWDEVAIGMSLNEVQSYYDENLNNANNHTNPQGYTFFSGWVDRDYTIQTYLNNEKVEGVVIEAPDSFNISIDNIIEALGTNQQLRVSYTMSVETNDVFPYVEIYYPQFGLLFHAGLNVESATEGMITTCIEPSSEVSKVNIVESGELQNVIADVEVASSSDIDDAKVERIVNSLQSWNDYSCYELAFPPIPVEN